MFAHTLALQANGSSISVEVNGNTVIGPVTDSAFTSGNAGVWSYAPGSAGRHRFDNFSVTTLGGGVYRKAKVLAMTDARRQAAVTAPPANTTYRVYYYANGKPIAMRVMPPNDATGTLYYLHADHLGSTSVTTNATGGVVARQWYYPYGAVRGSTGTLPTDITFTGQRSDATGLYFFQARYYSGTLGRFVSADSIVPGAGNPQALNRYAYSLSNPLKYTDPSGHVPCNSQKLCPTQAAKPTGPPKQPVQSNVPTTSSGSTTTPSRQGVVNTGDTARPISLLHNEPDQEDICFASPTRCVGPKVDTRLVDNGSTKRPDTAALVVIGIALTGAIIVTELGLTAAEIALAPIAATGNPLAIGGELILVSTSLFLVDVEIAWWVYVYRVETAPANVDVRLNLNPLEGWGLNGGP